MLIFAAETNQQSIAMKRTILVVLAMAALTTAQAKVEPEQVLQQARAVNGWFMRQYKDPTVPTFVGKKRTSNLWTFAVYMEGLTELYGVDPQQGYLDYIDMWGEHHKWEPRSGRETTDADNQCCGQTYIWRYNATKEERMMAPIRDNIDRQMASGRVDYWTWIDAIQMCLPVYGMLYKATGERKYIDHGMKMYGWSRKFYNPEEKLWWRDADYMPPYKEVDGSNCYWSRGNGWVIAALVRTMDCLDKQDAYYAQLKSDYLELCDGVLACQRADGFWNPSLVCEANYGGKETTGTALFLYGLSWGLNNGTLKAAKYRRCADRAWQALSSEAVHAEDGFLGYVQGTGKDPSAGQPVTYSSMPDFQDFGTGCFLLGAVEYYKLLKK